MRKGLTLTLLTVAAAMLGAKAQAMAPTISDIPSPVVANDIAVTNGGTNGNGNFVFLDAFDITTMATDDYTSSTNLMWTYSGSLQNPAGGSDYRINGVEPINVGVGGIDPTSPTAASIINRNDLDTLTKNYTDKSPRTITIRNNVLSPMSGTGGSVPSADGIVAAETQPVTFFCSDGTTYSSKTVFFYTQKGGSDRLSYNGAFKPVSTPGLNPDKITRFWRGTEWNAINQTGTNFSLTTSTVPGSSSGICLVPGLKGTNWGALASSYPYFNLASNQVYRIRLKMVGEQATTGKTPYWNFIIENYDDLHPSTMNLYIFSTGVYDVEGGANGLTTAEKVVTLYWAPPAVSTTQWNDGTAGAFTSARDANNDPRMRFRVIDADGMGNGELRSGRICIKEIEVQSAPMSRVQPVTTPGATNINITNFVDAKGTATSGKNVQYTPLFGSTATFANNAVTIVATGTGQTTGELGQFGPSTDGSYTGDPNKASDLDEYPISWVADQILRMQVDMTAPTQADEDNMWDAFCFLFLSFDNEVSNETYITSNQKCASPRVNATSTYNTFYYTGFGSNSSVANFKKLRWEIRLFNTPSTNFPMGNTANSGAVKITRVAVQQVTIQ